ncbi:FAD binding domain-containing protein [Candidatus Hodarchaeum mangrovi]
MYNLDIETPKSLMEALTLKNKFKDGIQPLAGGTDVLVLVRNKLGKWGASPRLLNLTQIQELKFITENDGFIEIGPLTTHTQILESLIIKQYFPAFVKAVAYVGSPQIRNLGTIIGNICRASPAADSLPVLYARDAQIQIQTINNKKIIPIEEFITGPGQTVLPNNALVTKLIIPKLPNYIGDYTSIRQRIALSIVVVSVAIEAQFNQEKRRLEDIRISLGAVSPTIIRARKTEKLLMTEKLTFDLIMEAKTKVKTECVPITDVRSNKEYRQAMTSVLLGRFLDKLIRS